MIDSKRWSRASGTRKHAPGVALDQGLAERVRALLADETDLRERKLFGGLCFLCGGNMACGIVGDELMVRVGPDAWSDALSQRGFDEECCEAEHA